MRCEACNDLKHVTAVDLLAVRLTGSLEWYPELALCVVIRTLHVFSCSNARFID